jgi:hypothetical protein
MHSSGHGGYPRQYDHGFAPMRRGRARLGRRCDTAADGFVIELDEKGENSGSRTAVHCCRLAGGPSVAEERLVQIIKNPIGFLCEPYLDSKKNSEESRSESLLLRQGL